MNIIPSIQDKHRLTLPSSHQRFVSHDITIALCYTYYFTRLYFSVEVLLTDGEIDM